MKSIAIFDFDGTLYKKDSFLEVCKFIFRKKPHRIVFFPIQFVGFLFFKLKILSAKQFKQLFCIYLIGIDPSRLAKLLSNFWKKEFPNIFDAKLLEKANELISTKVQCVCVSASPELFLQPAVDQLDFKLIGTRLEYKNGFYRIVGKNCRGKEKINRINLLFPKHKTSIEYAVSDNSDDKELLNLAKESLFIEKGSQL